MKKICKDGKVWGKNNSYITPDYIEKQRISHLGSKNPMFGKHRYGEKSPSWKGGITNIKIALNKWFNDTNLNRTWMCSKDNLERLKNMREHFSDETRSKMSETRKRLYREGKLIPPMLDKHLPKETRNKISETRKKHIQEGKIKCNGYRESPNYKEISKRMSERMKLNNPMKNPETVKRVKLKVGQTIKEKYWDKGLKFPCWLTTKEGKEFVRQRQLTDNTRRFNKCPSRPQIKLFNYYKSIYPEAKMEFPLKVDGHIYYLDIAIPSMKLDIEYDGKEWHKDKEKDNKRDEEISSLGWKIMRLNNIPSNIKTGV